MPIRADNISIADESTAGDVRPQQPGRAVNYNGTNQYSTGPTDLAIGTAVSSFTVCCWLYVVAPGNPRSVFAAKWVSSDAQRSFRYSVEENLTIRAQITSSTTASQLVQTSETVNQNQWHHIAITFDAGTVLIFIDGVQSVVVGAIDSTMQFHPTPAVEWGVSNFIYYFNGRILDGVMLNRVATPVEIAAWAAVNPHDATTEPDYGANVAAHWKLDDNSLTTGRDSSGNNNSLTHINSDPDTIYESNLIPWSWPNMVGYTDGGSDLVIPRNESNKSQDVDGGALEFTGRVPRDGVMIDSPCTTWNGTTQSIILDHLSGSETVTSSGGTSTPTVAAGVINFTAGTCWDLILSDGTHLPMSEGEGQEMTNVQGTRHGTIANKDSGTWAATQNLLHWSNRYGFSKLTHASDPVIEVPNKTDGDPPSGIVVPAGYTNEGVVPAGFMISDYTNLNLAAVSGAPFVGFYDTNPLETAYSKGDNRTSPPHYVDNAVNDTSKEFYSEAEV